jgi:hypothetical protein
METFHKQSVSSSKYLLNKQRLAFDTIADVLGMEKMFR